MAKTVSKRTKAAGAAGAVVCLVGALLVSARVPSATTAWVVTLILFVGFMASVGLALQGRPGGLLIDNRNRVSLSKFQAAAWTVLILSAFFTAAIFRIGLGFDDAVGIVIPNELLAAMGIAATSLVATPIVLSLKGADAATPDQIKKTVQKLDDTDKVEVHGKVYGRKDVQDAEWLDMFRGDEVGNAASPDLSKLQQFLITVVVLVTYGASLWKAFAAPELVTDESTAPAFFSTFPPLSQTVVWLVGISHAGYLAYKAAPHTPASPAGQDQTGQPAPPSADDPVG
jgi:hypothetical protein